MTITAVANVDSTGAAEQEHAAPLVAYMPDEAHVLFAQAPEGLPI